MELAFTSRDYLVVVGFWRRYQPRAVHPRPYLLYSSTFCRTIFLLIALNFWQGILSQPKTKTPIGSCLCPRGHAAVSVMSLAIARVGRPTDATLFMPTVPIFI